MVEDVPPLRDVLIEHLTRGGYLCVPAGSCAEARAAVSEHPFACALIDIGLPDGSGIDLVREFHESSPHLVPVLLTGEHESDTIIEALRAGAFDYLVKPVGMTTVAAGVTRAVTHHKVLRERDMLVDLLSEEREQLKSKIEAATADMRAYAESCEAGNALLHSLLDLTQVSAKLHSEEGLLRRFFEEMLPHVPLHCAALCDVTQREFLAAIKTPDHGIDVIISQDGSAQQGLDTVLAVAEPALLTRYWVQRHTGLDAARFREFVFPQSFWDRPVCTVGFYLDPEFGPDTSQAEYLRMCAHFIAYEWQRSRLLLHAARQAALGNIALEMGRCYLQSLAAARSAIDILAENVDSADAARGLAFVAENVNNMTRQTRLFQVLAGAREDSIETVRLDTYIDNALELLDKAIKTRGLAIERRFNLDAECVLRGGAALARTFLDLLSRAVGAQEPGGRLVLSLTAPHPDRIRFEMAHDSPGDLFGLSHHQPGDVSFEAVLGHPSFMLAQRTVHSCGGRLTLERENGHGVFRIELPRNVLHAEKGVSI